jgi:hypothetical protein
VTFLALFGLQFTGKIGIGTVLTFGAILVGVTVYLTHVFSGGDPADLREAYNTELERRREADGDKARIAAELAAVTARTDISGLEERMTRRMDAFEKHTAQQTKVLEGLVAAVQALTESKGHA